MSKIYTDPRDYILIEYELRKARNKSYSLRAFARDLGIAPSTLNEILKNKYGLSPRLVERFAKHLNLDVNEKNHFNDLFQRRSGKTARQRRQAAQSTYKNMQRQYHSIALDSFHYIADWYHLAILEWISIHHGKVEKSSATIQKIAKNFSITFVEAENALERLVRLQQIDEETDFYFLREEFTSIGTDVHSEANRKFHRQMMQKATHSLASHDLESREMSSTVFKCAKSQLKEAKKALKDFRREFAERFSSNTESDSVYCLGMQFFTLIDEHGVIPK